MSSIARALTERGKTQPTRKEPITIDNLRALVAALDAGTILGKRDKALILPGLVGAFWRSELT